MAFSLVDSVTTTADFSGWITFQVTDAVESWVLDSEANLGRIKKQFIMKLVNHIRATKPIVMNPNLFPNQGLFLKLERLSDGADLRPSDLGLVGTAPRRPSADADKEEEGDSLRRPFMVVFFKKPSKLRVRRTRAARKNAPKTKYEGGRKTAL